MSDPSPDTRRKASLQDSALVDVPMVAHHARAVALGSAASRVLGFARALLLVAALGSTTQTSIAYNAANTVPNMIYELLLGGVLSSVLVPALVRASDAGPAGIAFMQRLLCVILVVLGVASAVAIVCAPLLADALVPHDQRSLTASLAALLLPEMVFYGLAAIASAILNAHESFGTAAWAPAVNNAAVCLVIVTYWLVPGPAFPTASSMSTAQVLVLGLGTTAGVAAQASLTVLRLRQIGFRFRWAIRRGPAEAHHMTELRRAAGWTVLYVAISQIGVVAVQRAGAYHRSLTIFTNADLLFQIPFGVIVLSFVTAAMPGLARAAALRDRDEVVRRYVSMSRLALLWLLPITCGLWVLGPDLGGMLFGGAAFGRSAATFAGGLLIGKALAWCAFGLVPFAMVMIQFRVFYAMGDGRTPVWINLAMVTTKLAAIGAMNGLPLHAEGLNVATSLSYCVGAGLGHAVLRRRLGPGRRMLPWRRTVSVSLVAGCLAALVTAATHAVLPAGWRASTVATLLAGTVWLAVTWTCTRAHSGASTTD